MHAVNKKKTSYRELTVLELEHNQEVVTHIKMNLIQREEHVTKATINIIKSLHTSGIPPRKTMNIFNNLEVGVFCLNP